MTVTLGCIILFCKQECSGCPLDGTPSLSSPNCSISEFSNSLKWVIFVMYLFFCTNLIKHTGSRNINKSVTTQK